MAYSKLKLYNGALRELGERKLASLSVNEEPRRVLDTAYDSDFIDYVLSMGQWNFAIRTASIDPDESVTDSFGYSNAFEKPTDWIRTVALSDDEYQIQPLRDYKDEAGYWFAEADPLYVSWVSNGEDYGGDLANFPAAMQLYAETELASRICTRLTQNEGKTEKLIKLAAKRLTKALSLDAMDQSTMSMPEGNWAQSRRGYGRRNDQRRGN